jgi:uncharacterized membrane protein
VPESKKSQNVFLVFGRHLRNRIGVGLVLLIPAGITYMILRYVVDFLDGILRPAISGLARPFPGSGWIDLLPPVASILIALIVLYIAGLLAQNFIGRRTVLIVEGFVGRVPVLRAIYGTAREATNLLGGLEKRPYSRVVFVTFPHARAKSIGLVTGTYNGASGQRYLMVFVPTTPTPMSGFLLFVEENEVEDTDMSVDMALRMVVTAGITTGKPLTPAPWDPMAPGL